MSLFSTTTGVGVIDTRSRQGTITLPLTSQIPNRYIQFKDLYGSFGRSSLTLSTQGGESFEDGTTSKVLTDPFTFFTLYAASTTRWAQLGGTQTIQQTVSSLVVSSLTLGSGFGWIQLPPVQTLAVSTNNVTTDTITANSTTSMYISAQILYVSSIMGAVVGGGDVATSNITSTVAGLGTAGFISSSSLRSTVIGLGTLGYISTSQLVSTTSGLVDHLELQSTSRGLGTLGYLSSFNVQISSAALFTSSITASTITTSSLQVNSLTVGTGTGWLNLGPLQTVAISSIQTNTNALYANTSFFGTQSTTTGLQFFGLLGNYNNTVLAEVSTGTGTQELLMFKGSSVSDRVRVQTTGTFVVETGVSARLWQTINSNVTPSFVINTSSNVGIQTASPQTALDVAGTGRFQIASTLALNVSSITGGASVYLAQGILAADETITRATDVVVRFVPDFDPNNWIQNGGTNSFRFLPTIPGYYMVNCQITWAVGADSNAQRNVQIRKAGNTISIAFEQMNLNFDQTMVTSKITYMNGTTDYIDFSVYTGTSDASQTLNYGGTANSPGCFCSIHLIR